MTLRHQMLRSAASMALLAPNVGETVRTDGTSSSSEGGTTSTATEGQSVAGSQTAAPAVEGTPYAIIAGKEFASHEELAAYYDETFKTGKPAEAASEEASTGTEDEPDPNASEEEPPVAEEAAAEDTPAGVPTVEQIKANLQAAGGIFADPAYEAAAIEFEQNAGVVSPETITATAAAFGVDESAVVAFIDGQKAQRALAASTGATAVQAAAADLYSVVGGEAQYKTFKTWAQDTIAPEKLDTYTKTLDTNPAAAKIMLEGFAAEWKAAGGGDGPRDITEEAQGADTKVRRGATPYASQDQMMRDMADPRYQTDEAFRAKVAARMAAQA